MLLTSHCLLRLNLSLFFIVHHLLSPILILYQVFPIIRLPVCYVLAVIRLVLVLGTIKSQRMQLL